MSDSSLPRAATGAVVVAFVAFWTGIGHGQHSAPTAKTMLQQVGLPAIDRGLRDQDPPRAARTAQDADRLRLGNGDTLPYLRGSIIVKFKEDATSSGISAATAQVAGAIADRSSWADFDIVAIPSDTDPESAAAAMRQRADVEYAQPRYRNHAMSRPNDTLYSSQWNFPAIDMERAWDIQPGASSNIIVAVLDSGMAFRTGTMRYNSTFAFRLTPFGPLYPALGPVDVPFAAAPELGPSGSARFVAPRDFIWNDQNPVDLDGHGTHVAGTIGQLTNNGTGVAGMAGNVRIMPVKVLSTGWDLIFGSLRSGTDDVLARAIRYAVDNGARVINMSVVMFSNQANPVLVEALRYAASRNVFIAISAGNDGETGNRINTLAYLGSTIDGVVAVGAVRP